MAGMKGRSGGPRANAGGARPGAGRKAKEPAQAGDMPLMEWIESVRLGLINPTDMQFKAALAELPYKYQKLGEGGKKDQQAEAAKKAANKFAVPVPPKLVAAGGKKI